MRVATSHSVAGRTIRSWVFALCTARGSRQGRCGGTPWPSVAPLDAGHFWHRPCQLDEVPPGAASFFLYEKFTQPPFHFPPRRRLLSRLRPGWRPKCSHRASPDPTRQRRQSESAGGPESQPATGLQSKSRASREPQYQSSGAPRAQYSCSAAPEHPCRARAKHSGRPST